MISGFLENILQAVGGTMDNIMAIPVVGEVLAYAVAYLVLFPIHVLENFFSSVGLK